MAPYKRLLNRWVSNQKMNEDKERSYRAGAAQMRHAYDSALRELFGPLGITISDYLLKIADKKSAAK